MWTELLDWTGNLFWKVVSLHLVRVTDSPKILVVVLCLLSNPNFSLQWQFWLFAGDRVILWYTFILKFVLFVKTNWHAVVFGKENRERPSCSKPKTTDSPYHCNVHRCCIVLLSDYLVLPLNEPSCRCNSSRMAATHSFPKQNQDFFITGNKIYLWRRWWWWWLWWW